MKWAVAAGRSDLLVKKLSSITKYYLCGEHFTDDCFFDPPLNTRLKKTLNPVSIPVPTIFKCNIDKYVPKAKQNPNSIYAVKEDIDDSDDEKKNCCITNDGSSLSQIMVHQAKEGLSMKSLSVFHDHYNYTDISCFATSSLNNMPDIPQIVDVVEMNTGINDTFVHTAETDDTFTETIEILKSSYVCRLCANTFTSNESLYELSSYNYDQFKDLMRNYVSEIQHPTLSIIHDCFK